MKDCFVPVNVDQLCGELDQAEESFFEHWRVLFKAHYSVVLRHDIPIEIPAMFVVVVLSCCFWVLGPFALVLVTQVVGSLNEHAVVIPARNPVLAWMAAYREFGLSCSATCPICHKAVICANSQSSTQVATLLEVDFQIRGMSWLIH